MRVALSISLLECLSGSTGSNLLLIITYERATLAKPKVSWECNRIYYNYIIYKGRKKKSRRAIYWMYP